jgi:calcineurin-like phosphoesterase family protein
MTLYFTSDLHFGHRLVAKHRGYEDDVPGHDAEIIEAWKKHVQPDDIVWVLGDVSVSNPKGALITLADLPGRKRLVAGNHDPVHPMHRDAPKWAAKYAAVFEYVAPFARIKVCGVEALLSHFPYERDRNEETRYPQWRLPDLGLPLLHGHTHSIEKTWPGTKEVHVGWDAWRRPVTDIEVKALIDE